MPITTTFQQVISPSIVIATGSVGQGIVAPGVTIVNSSAVIASTVTNLLTTRIRDIVGQSDQGYGLGAYLSLPVNTSTRVTARTYNSILTDLDLVLRHITSASIVNSLTQLSTWTDSLVVSTGSLVSATQWQSVVNLVDFAALNRYSVHPGQLATDPNGCTVTYDQSISYRTTSWGTGTSSVITMEVRAEWPQSYLADSFFNTGGDFVFSPFIHSMGLVTSNPVATGTNLTLQTALDTADISVPLSLNGQSIARGPLFHVDPGQWFYGPPRTSLIGDVDFFYRPGVGVSGNAAYLNQNPQIYGTPFQFVGVHYGDYTTQLVIGVRQGQEVPTESTQLTVYLNNDQSRQYVVTVPGRHSKYEGPTPTANLDAYGTEGWWIYRYYDYINQTGASYYQDNLIPWIEIYSGRKGSDPIGLTDAVNSRLPFSLQIVPNGLAPGSASSSTGVGSTVTNAWAQFIDELRAGAAQSYSYDRSRWRDSAWQTTTSIFTSSIGTNTNKISIAATRDTLAVGQSKRINFVLTATNFEVNNVISYYHPYTYTTSSQTCTNTISAGNTTDGATGDYGGVGGSGFPWWIVAVGIVSVVTGVCFTGPTLVRMADGSRRAIRDIKIGDRVWNHDMTQVNTVVFIEHKFRQNMPIFSPTVDHAPFVTDNHPLIEQGKILSADPDRHWINYPWLGKAEPILNPVVFHTPGETVYNLWLDGDHTYWVNDWATHSIIGSGDFLRICVEQGHITAAEAIDILEGHTSGHRALIIGSYWVNRALGRLNVSMINKYVSRELAKPRGLAKSCLRSVMTLVGVLGGAYYHLKYHVLGKKLRISR